MKEDAGQFSRLMRDTTIANKISAPMARPVPPVSQQLAAASKNATSIIPRRNREGKLTDKGLRKLARFCMVVTGPIAFKSSLLKTGSATSAKLVRSAAGELSVSILADSPRHG